MLNHHREVWNFCVRCAGAQQVYLAVQASNEPAGVVPMNRVRPNVWQVSLTVPAQGWNYCYYVEDQEGQTRRVSRTADGPDAAPAGILEPGACCACRATWLSPIHA